jgi:hypothetical protein
MAGGVTPGDAPGFPVTISQPGSYVLSGILTVPDGDTDAVVINASHVTLDLNGFAILGPTDCSGGSPCLGRGFGSGIVVFTVQFNITIRNGTIQGMGLHGIHLNGDSHLVEYVHVRSNGSNGIDIGASADQGSSIVQHNTAERNGSYGIYLERGSVNNNVVDVNFFGIALIVGSASQNVITRNEQGLLLNNTASYFGNVLSGNTTNVVNGKNLGQNLCNTAVCPGAQF